MNLIVGGLGLLGINLYKQLKESKQATIIIDNCSGDNLYNISEVHPEDLLICDIRDYEKLKSIFLNLPFKVQNVYIFAAHFANQKSLDFPVQDIEINIIGQLNIIQSISALKEPSVNVVYTSSSCIYQNISDQKECNYSDTFDTPYAINKFTAEFYYKLYQNMVGYHLTIVRLYNMYGPYELSSHYRNVIPKFIDAALNGDEIVITGTGNETRDFTYVEDVCSILTQLIKRKDTSRIIFNIGSGRETSIMNLAQLIIAKTSSSSNIVLKDRRGWDHVLSRKANIDNLAQCISLEPFTSVESGLEKTISWYAGKVK